MHANERVSLHVYYQFPLSLSLFFLLFISEMILTRNIIVCGYTNGEVRAMDKRVAAKLLFENSYKSQMIGSVAFDDKLLVSGCDDGQVNVFNFLQL